MLRTLDRDRRHNPGVGKKGMSPTRSTLTLHPMGEILRAEAETAEVRRLLEFDQGGFALGR